MKNINVWPPLIIGVVVAGMVYLLYPTTAMEQRIEQQIRSVVTVKSKKISFDEKEERQKEMLQRLESIEELVGELHRTSIASIDTKCVCGAE